MQGFRIDPQHMGGMQDDQEFIRFKERKKKEKGRKEKERRGSGIVLILALISELAGST